MKKQGQGEGNRKCSSESDTQPKSARVGNAIHHPTSNPEDQHLSHKACRPLQGRACQLTHSTMDGSLDPRVSHSFETPKLASDTCSPVKCFAAGPSSGVSCRGVHRTLWRHRREGRTG